VLEAGNSRDKIDQVESAINAGRLDEARILLETLPPGTETLRLRAQLAFKMGHPDAAERALRQFLELAPGHERARANLASVLHSLHRSSEAIDEISRLRLMRNDDGVRKFEASALAQIGRYHDALAIHERLLEHKSEDSSLWMSYGYLLKTVSRLDESVAAYRRAIALAPTAGEAWWHLTELKTFAILDSEVAVMEATLSSADLSEEDRFHLELALGEVFDRRGNPARAFAHFDRANALRRARMPNDRALLGRIVAESMAIFDASYFVERAGQGFPASDPIFIVGMPRSGSTLVEQILDCHPAVEGTAELPYITAMARRLVRGRTGEAEPYAHKLAKLDGAALSTLGEAYMVNATAHRRTAKPHFIDKMPNNWAHLGLICSILPRARIVDVRRHPLDCGFSNFRQHFTQGQAFSYALEDIGTYYRDYVALMAHFDRVRPGAVHQVIYEDLVDAPETEIQRLLDALGLPFDPACLAFHVNRRAVYTPSAEQVRRPINRAGIGRWRDYEPWLDPLKRALGPVLDAYPQAPQGEWWSPPE